MGRTFLPSLTSSSATQSPLTEPRHNPSGHHLPRLQYGQSRTVVHSGSPALSLHPGGHSGYFFPTSTLSFLISGPLYLLLALLEHSLLTGSTSHGGNVITATTSISSFHVHSAFTYIVTLPSHVTSTRFYYHPFHLGEGTEEEQTSLFQVTKLLCARARLELGTSDTPPTPGQADVMEKTTIQNTGSLRQGGKQKWVWRCQSSMQYPAAHTLHDLK